MTDLNQAVIEPQIVELEPQWTAVRRGEEPMADLPAFFGAAFAAVLDAVEAGGLTVTGPPISFYPVTPTDVVILDAGFPTNDRLVQTGDVRAFQLPGGKAVVLDHVGPYDTLEQTYTRLMDWLGEQGLVPAAGMWEIYLTDPSVDTDPATWRTRIVWPVLDS